MKSIILQEEGTCWLCERETPGRYYGKGQLHKHHIFYGTANRRMSERYGMTVMLCYEHHEGKNGVHSNPINDGYLKRYAQNVFEQKYSREKFIKVFGKSWL